MALDLPIGTLHERIEGMDSRALGWTIGRPTSGEHASTWWLTPSNIRRRAEPARQHPLGPTSPLQCLRRFKGAFIQTDHSVPKQ